LVHIGVLGLALCLPNVFFGKLIWQDLNSGHSVSFSKYDTVTISSTVPSSQKETVLNALKNSFNNNAKIVVLNDIGNELDKIFGSQLFLHFAVNRTEDPNINLLKIYATTATESKTNKESLNGIIWEKTYLFENNAQLDMDLKSTLEEGISAFASQYVKTNPEFKEKATFYFFNN